MAAADALARYGNKPMPELRYDLAKSLGQVAGLMRCKCGHKGARLMVRHLSR
jgi:hypothetical protein